MDVDRLSVSPVNIIDWTSKWHRNENPLELNVLTPLAPVSVAAHREAFPIKVASVGRVTNHARPAVELDKTHA